jgi:hypothetical protein
MWTVTRRTGLVVAALIAGTAISACGGDDATPGAKAPDAHAAFVAKADAICKTANDKEAALGAEGAGWMFGGQYDDVEFLEAFNEAGRVALADLRKLDPPAEDRARMAAMTDALGRMVAALDARLEVLRAGKRENDSVIEYERGYADLVTAAGPLGLSECQGVLL